MTKNKYHSKKAVVDGIEFDSKKEAKHYQYLKVLKSAGEITYFDRQVKFVLIDKYKYKGKAVRECAYLADFVVHYRDGRVQVVDVKGYRTDVYKLKKKLLLWRYPEIDFIEI